MKADITSILESSENLKEDLLALGEELWMSIDHSDNASLQEGIEVKKEFNDAVQKFTDSIDEVSEIVDNDSSDKLDPAPESTTSEDADRVIRELDRHEEHSLNEDFAYRRPHGFQLDDFAVSDVRTWRRFYEVTCHHLSERFPERFDQVVEADDFESSHGNRYFATDPGELRTPSEVAEGIFAEVHFSADDIAGRISELLEFFGLDAERFKVYLREDRDAAE